MDTQLSSVGAGFHLKSISSDSLSGRTALTALGSKPHVQDIQWQSIMAGVIWNGVAHDKGMVHDGKFSLIGSITLLIVSEYLSGYRVAHTCRTASRCSWGLTLVSNHPSHVSLPLDGGYSHQTGLHLRPVL